jgi:hypothetical protein
MVFDLPKVGFEPTDPAKSRDRYRTQSQRFEGFHISVHQRNQRSNMD